MRMDFNHLDIIKYGKKKSKDYIIYSTPFIKFDDVSSIMKKVHMDSIVKEPDSYYIFRKDVQICNGKTIGDILMGVKLKSNLNLQRFGYFSIPNFPIKSIGWDITRNYKEDVVLKKSATPRVDIPVEKALTPKVSEKIQVVEKVLVPEKIQVVEKIKGPKRVGSRKIDVVIVSVNYNDFLLISLENNSKIFENITVVTSSSDFLCQKICKKFGVKCVVTDIMYEDSAPFNKGKAINAAIGSISDPDYILLLDADILVMDNIYLDSLDDELLYTSDRYIVPDYDSYQRYISGGLDKDSEFILDVDKGLGFFQLFNSYIQIDYPESSKDASLCDIIFRDKFDKSATIDNIILHLGNDSNWKGRKSKSFLDFDEFYFLLEKKSDFKICTFYYNPKNDLLRKENFLKFLDQFKGYENNLLIGLVDYGDEITSLENFNLFKIEGDKENNIWYKETLINRMIDIVDTDYIIWMDCDLIYESLDWLENIDSVVEGKDFVQLYETINYLGLNGEIIESHKSILSSGREDIDMLLGEGYKPGGSWIGKTSILKETRFFEKMYVGGGDTIFVYGLFNIKNGRTLNLVKKNNEYIFEEALVWINGFGSYKTGYLKESVSHLYHGSLKDRSYDKRYEGLKRFEREVSFLTKNIIEKGFFIDGYLLFGLEFDKNSVYILKIRDKIYDISLTFENDKGVIWTRKFSPITIFITDDSDSFFLKINSREKINFKSDDFIFEKFSSDTNGVKIDEDFSLFLSNNRSIIKDKNQLLILNGIKSLKNLKKYGVECRYILSKRSLSKQKVEDLIIPRFGETRILGNFKEDNSIEPEKNVVSLATYPKRRDMLIETLKSLIDQFDLVNIYLNNYTLENIDDELVDILDNEKINYVIDPFGNYRAAAKFFWISIFDGYHFICDDDITYPENYYEYTKKYLDDDSIVGYLGVKFDEEMSSYPHGNAQRPTNIRFGEELKEKTKVHLIGTGVSAFKNKNLFPEFRYMLQFVTYNDDLLSIYAKQNNINLFAIPKEKDWIKSNEEMEYGLYEEKTYDTKKEIVGNMFISLNPWI
jgi:hypothetical protein